MHEDLYVRTCNCHKVPTLIRPELVNEGRTINYPTSEESYFKTFEIKYEHKLSSVAKMILNGFTNKYIYYAIDDILYLSKLNPIERDNLLSILYSPIISLHNDFSVNFFDIWIHQISIKEYQVKNRFLTKKLNRKTSITIKLWYKVKIPVQYKDSLW